MSSLFAADHDIPSYKFLPTTDPLLHAYNDCNDAYASYDDEKERLKPDTGDSLIQLLTLHHSILYCSNPPSQLLPIKTAYVLSQQWVYAWWMIFSLLLFARKGVFGIALYHLLPLQGF